MEENNQIVEKITKIVNPFIEEMDLSLVDVEYVQDGGYWYVRIFIENLNGDLNIEDCSKLSSKIEDKVEELIEHKFFLEVSSPGLERPLKKLEDYTRFTGEKITLHLKHKLDDKKQFKAIIKEVNGDNIIFLIDKKDSKLFENVSSPTVCWMSHFDYVSKIPESFEISAYTKDCPVAVFENEEKKLYGIQYHPEVLHTKDGSRMIGNFLRNVCKCECNWKMDAFVETEVEKIKEKVGSGKVLCALSGGVDSSVAAVLLSKAVGEQLTCVFVDHGLLRKNEADEG